MLKMDSAGVILPAMGECGLFKQKLILMDINLGFLAFCNLSGSDDEGGGEGLRRAWSTFDKKKTATMPDGISC